MLRVGDILKGRRIEIGGDDHDQEQAQAGEEHLVRQQVGDQVDALLGDFLDIFRHVAFFDPGGQRDAMLTCHFVIMNAYHQDGS